MAFEGVSPLHRPASAAYPPSLMQGPSHTEGPTVHQISPIDPTALLPFEEDAEEQLMTEIEESLEKSTQSAFDSSLQVQSTIDDLKKTDQKLTTLSTQFFQDSKEKAVQGLKGATYGILGLYESISIITELIGIFHHSPAFSKMLKLINSGAGQIASPIMSSLKLATAPIEFVITKNTKEGLDKYLEELQYTLTAVPSDRQLIEDLISKLQDDTTSLTDIVAQIDQELNDPEGIMPPFSVVEWMHPNLSEEKINALDPSKEKKKLLSLLKDASTRTYLLDRRNDCIAFSFRKMVITSLKGENVLKACLALQNRYIHQFITPEDFPDEEIDVNDLDAIQSKIDSDPQFQLMLEERIETFIHSLKTDPAFIKQFNTRFCAYEDKLRGLHQMLEQRKQVALKSFHDLIQKAGQAITEGTATFNDLKADFIKYGINLEEMKITTLEELQALGVMRLTDFETLQSQLKENSTLQEMFRNFRDPSEALLVSSRNGLKVLTIEKANTIKNFFKFNWFSAKVLLPIEMTSSTIALISGILILAGVMASPPLFVTMIGGTALAIGIGFMLAGFIHQLRHKPRTLYESTIKLRGIRKSYRAFKLKRAQNAKVNQQKKLEIHKLIHETISVRLANEALSPEVKESLEAVQKEIPKGLQKILMDETRVIKPKDQGKLLAKQEAYSRKIETIEANLRQSEIEFAKRKEELAVHLKALSNAGLKDAVYGGISFRQYFGFAPRVHQSLQGLHEVFPEIQSSDLEEEEGEPLRLVEALVALEQNQRLDAETKAFLQKQLALDLKSLKDKEKTREELARFFSGGVSQIKELILYRNPMKI